MSAGLTMFHTSLLTPLYVPFSYTRKNVRWWCENIGHEADTDKR